MGTLVAGLDGCRNGWVLVTTAADGFGDTSVEVIAHLDEVIERLDSAHIVAAGIDISIGLPARSPRPCDPEARRMIRPRHNSVFPAPIRAVLNASSYEEACGISRTLDGKGMSKQAFAILPKIKEVDGLLSPQRQQQLFEVHPEVCFTVLAGHPMSAHKATESGRAERLRALSGDFPDIEEYAARSLPGTHPDDVLDAFAAAWSARRWVSKTHLQLGGDLDEMGLRMEMIA